MNPKLARTPGFRQNTWLSGKRLLSTRVIPLVESIGKGGNLSVKHVQVHGTNFA